MTAWSIMGPLVSSPAACQASGALVAWRPSADYLSYAMATVLKRLRMLGLALTFLFGATVQLLPPSMAMAGMSTGAGMAGGYTAPQFPCTNHMPNCIEHL